jgi:flagellar biosynthesis protein
MMASDTPTDDRKDRPVAVALKYSGAKDPAPRITAKGRGAIAERIIEVARANGIEVHEDADLVQLLAKLELNSFIPVEAFAAVAEILSYVYKKNRTLKADRETS